MRKSVLCRVLGILVMMSFLVVGLLGQGAATAGTLADKCKGPTIDKLRSAGKIRGGIAVEAPFVMQNPKTSEYFGVSIEYGKELEKRLGIKVEQVVSDWGLLVADLQANKIDVAMASLNVTPERQKVVDFAEPFYQMGMVFIVLKSNNKINKVEDINSENVTVATLTGTGGEQMTKRMFPKAKILSVEHPGEPAAMTDVFAGKGDTTPLGSIMTNAYVAEFKNIKAIPPDAFTNPVGATPIAWALRQGETDLKGCLDQFFKDLKADGTIDKLMAQYTTMEYLKPGQ
jgi:polar amino acid transport system substrate-binding protein